MLIQTGYHGPPGDDRGSMPCPTCQNEAFGACLRKGGFIYGVSLSEAFDAIQQANGDAPVDWSPAHAEPAEVSEAENAQREQERERQERREEILEEMRVTRRTDFLA
jgi:hypothetical protein